MQKIYHPQPDEAGQHREIKQPSTPTPLSCWQDSAQLATTVPLAPLPAILNGIALATWDAAPTDAAQWNGLAHGSAVAEPAFLPPPGKASAAGVVMVEPDGRVWLVAPSNRFGGYTATFPKGRVEHGVSLQATALREAYEESGLQVVLTGFLVDSVRSTSCTRYYLARRVGGNPALMCWETQAVHLVPLAELDQVASHPNDAPVIAALKAALAHGQ